MDPWLNLSENTKRGYVALLVVLFMILIGIMVVSNVNRKQEPAFQPEAIDSTQLMHFRDALKDKPYSSDYAADNSFYSSEPATFYFNPNTCDSATFVRLGLKPWMARNAMKYRKAGGYWKSADDFRRLYGLSDADFERLRPFIQIDAPGKEPAAVAQPDTFTAKYPQKYLPGMRIDINTCDTLALRGIPGIGAYYARKIYEYRTRLGGFHSLTQLHDIEGLPDGISDYLYIQSDAVLTRIHINSASFKTLVRHPYLNYEQTRDIVNYIKKYGPLKSWNDLQFSSHFTEKDFQRLAPYFDFK
ncbi:MAG: helix-hairpin-helix domain-containing protein [Alloprevotella sp.]|nr:helix-hairpin-helix domain-containing protein [Alloprevotella sp.]